MTSYFLQQTGCEIFSSRSFKGERSPNGSDDIRDQGYRPGVAKLGQKKQASTQHKKELDILKDTTKIQLRELGTKRQPNNLPWNTGAIFGGVSTGWRI